VAELLRSHGADAAMAAAIVEALEHAGLKPARMRGWLASSTRAYTVNTGTLVIAGTEYPRGQTPIFAVEDGHQVLVLEAARAFASASPEEREICLTCLCELDDLQAMTHGDPVRTRQVLGVARTLLAQLGKDTTVYLAMRGCLDAERSAPRIIDCLADERFADTVVAIERGDYAHLAANV
jgi:hypothetical protein